MTNIPLLLLAAGGSARMGSPKSLLRWGNKYLIEHQIESLLGTKQSLTVVLGANAKEIRAMIEHYPITVLENDHWEGGMGTSISYGVQFLTQQHPNLEAVLIALIDQPLLSTKDYSKILTLFHIGRGDIILSESENGEQGPPALFDKLYMESLLNLKGDVGAKPITLTHKSKVKTIRFGRSLMDIDTPEAYQEALKYLKLPS